MSKKLKDQTKEDMSKVLDCSSFQIKPLQACITETAVDDFNLPDTGKVVCPRVSRNKLSCCGLCLKKIS